MDKKAMFDRFPVEQVKGCRYSGVESGKSFEGTIAQAAVGNDRIEFINTEGKPAFSFSATWGSWYRKGNNIEVDIPLVGSYTIFGVPASESAPL